MIYMYKATSKETWDIFAEDLENCAVDEIGITPSKNKDVDTHPYLVNVVSFDDKNMPMPKLGAVQWVDPNTVVTPFRVVAGRSDYYGSNTS